MLSVFLQKKTGLLKTQEKERWKEKRVVKRPKTEVEEVEEEEENVQPIVDPLENGFFHHAQREQERMNERLLKKTYSKKNKMVSVVFLGSLSGKLHWLGSSAVHSLQRRMYFSCEVRTSHPLASN